VKIALIPYISLWALRHRPPKICRIDATARCTINYQFFNVFSFLLIWCFFQKAKCYTAREILKEFYNRQRSHLSVDWLLWVQRVT